MDFQGIMFLIIGSVILISILAGYSLIANPTISLESRNFAINDHYYDIAHPTVQTDTFHLYYFNNITNEISATRYTVTTSQVKISTNGTLGYPNVTIGTYYYSYTYTQPFTIWDSDMSAILGFGLIAIILITIYYLAKYRSK